MGAIGVEDLIATILKIFEIPKRVVTPDSAFLFSIDHCF